MLAPVVVNMAEWTPAHMDAMASTVIATSTTGRRKRKKQKRKKRKHQNSRECKREALTTYIASLAKAELLRDVSSRLSHTSFVQKKAMGLLAEPLRQGST
mmetsp:Transcript_21208/g.38126  ORF Transcript_21208/g.38126 Transcript_21208/m.38126 type:complete len:100 (+) Transcript_21208:881-1180(+)